jgi:hypothetical protein
MTEFQGAKDNRINDLITSLENRAKGPFKEPFKDVGKTVKIRKGRNCKRNPKCKPKAKNILFTCVLSKAFLTKVIKLEALRSHSQHYV